MHPKEEDKLAALIKRPALQWVPEMAQRFPGSEIFLVGGCIRDALLGRDAKDLDVVIRRVNGPDIETVLAKFGTVNLIGETFGIYKFRHKNLKEEVDIALPRTEHPQPSSHGGHREFQVETRSDLPIQFDLGRRDFTINAIALNIREMKIVDPFHGLRDLNAQIIRTVGNPAERFKEDLSRLLRAVRFACTLNFHIEPQTWKAMQTLASSLQNRVDNQWVIPRETIGKEFLLSFFSDPICTLQRYQSADFSRYLFPSASLETAGHQLKEHAGLSPLLLVLIFLGSFGNDDAEEFFRTYHLSQFPKTGRLHLDEEKMVKIFRAVKTIELIDEPSALSPILFERYFLGEQADDLLTLLQIIRPKNDQKLARIKTRREAIKKRWGEDVPPLIVGEDLIKIGAKPGPLFRQIQQIVRQAQLSDLIANKDEALRLAREIIMDSDKEPRKNPRPDKSLNQSDDDARDIKLTESWI